MWRRMFKAGVKYSEQFGWILGEGDISFWHDIWLADVPLASLCDPQAILRPLKVCDFWVGDDWDAAKLWLVSEEHGVPWEVIEEILLIPFDRGEKDRVRWKPSPNGNFSVASAWELVRHRAERRAVHEFIWGNCVGPSISMFLWRLLANRVPVDTKLQWRGISLASRCRCCSKPDIESRLHLFVNGEAARSVWNHFARWFPHVPPFAEEGRNIDLRLRWWQRHMNMGTRQHICSIIPCLILWCLWTERNECVHREKLFSVENIIKRIIGMLKNLVLGRQVGPEHWRGSCPKVDFMVDSAAAARPRKVGRVQWRPPDLPWIKVNTDGAFLSSTREAGGGGVVRDHNGEILAAFASVLKVESGLEAEVAAILEGLVLAKQFGVHMHIESDADLVVGWIRSGHLGPMKVRHVLARIRGELKGIDWKISHILREGNKAADHLAELGCRMSSSLHFTKASTPARVKALCRMDQLGFPNFRF